MVPFPPPNSGELHLLFLSELESRQVFRALWEGQVLNPVQSVQSCGSGEHRVRGSSLGHPAWEKRVCFLMQKTLLIPHTLEFASLRPFPMSSPFCQPDSSHLFLAPYSQPGNCILKSPLSLPFFLVVCILSQLLTGIICVHSFY